MCRPRNLNFFCSPNWNRLGTGPGKGKGESVDFAGSYNVDMSIESAAPAWQDAIFQQAQTSKVIFLGEGTNWGRVVWRGMGVFISLFLACIYLPIIDLYCGGVLSSYPFG